MATPAQLRIATRIHFILKHELGEGINVAAMLSDPREEREVLYVCVAMGKPELSALAHQFVTARALAEPDLSQADAPQDAAWARNTSGFGLSPSTDAAPPAAPARRSPRLWLRRGANRT